MTEPVLSAPEIKEHAAKNFGDRRGNAINSIVLHHTAGTNSLGWLTDSPKKVSIHRLITKSGLIYRMVPDNNSANHVGFSNLGRYVPQIRSPNLCTLGIEIENLGNGKDPYTAEQYNSVGWQIADWWRIHGSHLPVITHAIIDTQGKNDPYKFDYARAMRMAVAWYSGTR